jgi:hypothetical protein
LNNQTQHYSVDRRKPATNSGLAKVAVSFSADSFVVNQTLVLRIIICGKNRHLRKAANRWLQPVGVQPTLKGNAKLEPLKNNS